MNNWLTPTMGIGGLLNRSRGADRQQPTRTGVACHPHGKKGVALLLDRAWCAPCRHHAKSNRHLQAARHRLIRLPRRCAAAGRPTSRKPGSRAHATAMEAALRRQSATFRFAHPKAISKNSDSLPVTERMLPLGVEPAPSTSAEFVARLQAETTKWAKLIKDANISPAQ